MKAIDTSANTIAKLDCFAKAGVRAIGRYYSRSAWKRLTREEAQAISDAGLSLWTVYQDANDSYAAFTAARGRAHAVRALAQACALGQPKGSAIYFAVDYDASPREAAGRIAAYFVAVRETFAAGGSPYRIGAYGNGAVCELLLDRGLVELAWLSMSTGHHGHRAFAEGGRWALRQRLETKLCGVAVDPNDLPDPEQPELFGGFRLPPTPVTLLVVTASRLNLRARPNGRILTRLDHGLRVERLGPSSRRGWLRVRAGGVEGHAYAAYLRPLAG